MNTPISFEIAKLLKEKGYDRKTLESYEYRGVEHQELSYKGRLTKNKLLCDILAPTISEVIMWLYDKHGIWIEANFLPNVDKFSFIAKPVDFKKPKEFPSYKDYYAATSKFIAKNQFNSPTEAYEAAIDYTLKNLI